MKRRLKGESSGDRVACRRVRIRFVVIAVPRCERLSSASRGEANLEKWIGFVGAKIARQARLQNFGAAGSMRNLDYD